ncbi:hypothetical protein ACI6Q2_14415 [Chitinophagaceae bacterium LWZ2-11]
MMQLKVTPYVIRKGLNYKEARLQLKKVDFNQVTYKDGTTIISFSDCMFQNLTIENNEEINFENISVTFFNCIIFRLEVKTITSKNISIGFHKSVVSGQIENGNLSRIDFNNCLIPNSVFLKSVPKVHITHTKENIKLDHWESLFKQFRVQGDNAITAPHRYFISAAKHIHCSSNYDLSPETYKFKTHLTLTYDHPDDHIETAITGFSLQSLSISGKPSGKLSIENTKIDSWFIYNFYPKGDVSFYNITPVAELSNEDAKIGIHRCNLDKVWFDNVSFDKYPIISFYRTKFSKAIFTSCDFPDSYARFSKFMEIENVHYPDKIPANYDKAQYEIFLQLKKALEDTGNYYESQKLQAIAHDALKRIKGISWWDKSILCINGLSNDHGLSIKRPFIGFLVSSILLYVLYLMSIHRIFNSNEFDFSLIGYYFSFVDITHRTDFLVKENYFTVWSLSVDYFTKIIVGFFVFQFIAAFRKYGKK